MAVIPVKYTNSNTTLGFSGSDLSNILLRREYFSSGGLYSWGTNLDFGLGDPGSGTTAISRSSPATVGRMGTVYWEWISQRARTAAAIKADGTLWTWGRATYGVLGDGTTTSRSSPGTVSGGGTNWDVVSTSTSHMLSVKNDGTLWTWGRNSSGQLGNNNTTSRSSPASIIGANTAGDSWKIVAAGGDSSLAIKSDGTLWSWGLNSSGQLGSGNTTARSSAVTVVGGGTTWDKISMSNITTVGSAFAAAVKTDGTLWTWGGNARGQLGDGNTSQSRSSPATVAGGGTTWKDVACGDEHAIAVTYNGILWSWGSNTNGELGAGITTSRSSPGTVAGGGTTWKDISASTNISGAIKSDGSLWTWGTNSQGQLGDGTTTNKNSPVSVTGGLMNWKVIAVGGATTGGACVGILENEAAFPQISTYTVPGTFTETIPQGMSSAFFEVWGGGGPGGDGYSDGSTTSSGGGGGSAGYSRTTANVRFMVNKTISLNVGAGGVAQVDPGGANSNISSGTFIVTTIQAGGGSKGGDASISGAGPGGSGGAASGGTEINTTGASGTAGITQVGITSAGGAGAPGTSGRNSLSYGASGIGGTALIAPGVYAGLNGADGAVIITYF